VKRLPTHREPVPLPSESQHLSFEQERMPILVVPDFIVYSPKIDAYIAFRSEFKSATLVAADINERREWHTFDSIREKSGPVSLKFDFAVYIADCPEDLALIADSRMVLRPDLIIDRMGQGNWHEDELENARLCHEALKSKLGTYIISQETVPQDVREKPGADIHVLAVGLNQSKLVPIHFDSFYHWHPRFELIAYIIVVPPAKGRHSQHRLLTGLGRCLKLKFRREDFKGKPPAE